MRVLFNRVPLTTICVGDDDSAAKLYTVYEAQQGNVSLYSADLSDKRRPVNIRIRSVPKHGVLFDATTGYPLYNGSLLNLTSYYPYEEPLLVTYLGNANYFNSPKVRYNDSALSFQEGDDDDAYAGAGGLFTTHVK